MAPAQVSDNSSFASILDDRFSARSPNVDFSILRSLKVLHPDKRHVALLDSATCPSFPVSGFLDSLGIRVEIIQEPLHDLVRWNSKAGAGSAAGLQLGLLADLHAGARTDKGELVPHIATGSLKFKYEGTEFLVYKVTWHQGICDQICLFDFVFDDPGHPRLDDGTYYGDEAMKSAGHNLISEVYRWAGALKDEMWVFQDGVWSKDKPLWGAIRDATWDEIVLETDFLEGLRRDTRTFFANRKIYKNLGVVWKRGLLLLGPPGNGKTESIKVLLKESGQAALYVKSFTTQDGPELGVRRIFDHARANAPCILVIEDLDSLVTSDVRAFFLNELDGLGQNEGILTIATTNHPERIDDAILNRPSRFDVKYNFDLPTEKLRVTYASKWIRKITALTTDEEGSSAGGPIVQFEKNTAKLAEEVAKETEGWSFAFLKELFVSFLLRIAHDKTRLLAEGNHESMASTAADTILMEQIKALSSQIVHVTSKEKDDQGGDDTAKAAMNFNKMMRRRVVQVSASLASAMPVTHSGPNF